MITRDENKLLTRVGPGTPMGDLHRRYWIPAALSRELPEPDCTPVRTKLLGEELVAFRDTQGRIGLIEEFCAHRGASLFLGRNEEGGLRCVNHGWKYDVDGNCLEMPNAAEESTLRPTIHLKAYPTLEMGGLIWTYMGPKEKMPAAPKFEWTQVPENRRTVAKMWEECNWLQAVEGNFDTCHPAFLHRNLTSETTRAGVAPGTLYMRSSTKPDQQVELTDYGFLNIISRPIVEGGTWVHINLYVMPFSMIRVTFGGGEGFLVSRVNLPGADSENSIIEGHIIAPSDDENCFDYAYRCFLTEDSPEVMARREEEVLNYHVIHGRGPADLTTDFRKLRNRGNNWLIDRQVQKTETYTGIDGLNTQDHAAQESMKPIVDRTRLNYVSGDRAIIELHRLLMNAVKTVQNGGDPPGIKPTYYTVRPTARIVPPSTRWQDAIKDDISLAKPKLGAAR